MERGDLPPCALEVVPCHFEDLDRSGSRSPPAPQLLGGDKRLELLGRLSQPVVGEAETLPILLGELLGGAAHGCGSEI